MARDGASQNLYGPLKTGIRVTGHTLAQMRRLVVFSLFVFALALPAAAFALHATAGDGTLVIKNGAAPKGQPVVQLVITGAAIGRIRGFGKILIDDANPNNAAASEVTGADGCKDLSALDPRNQLYGNTRLCTGTEFRFRAVGDTYAITIYGSGVNLVAIGQGKAILGGGDGTYSLNGGDFRDLPDTPSKPLVIGLPIG